MSLVSLWQASLLPVWGIFFICIAHLPNVNTQTIRFRTVASALNSLAAVTLKDFVSELAGYEIAHDKEARWAKWISLIFGGVSFALVR